MKNKKKVFDGFDPSMPPLIEDLLELEHALIFPNKEKDTVPKEIVFISIGDHNEKV